MTVTGWRTAVRLAAYAWMILGLSGATVLAQPPGSSPRPRRGGDDDFPPYNEVIEGYEKVDSTADDDPSLYTIWVRKHDNQMLAELPKDYARQRHFFALTIASGDTYAGLQLDQHYVYWKRINNRMALVEPNVEYRATGDDESKASVERLFTDRVLVDVPIVTLTPQKTPVIDMDELLVGRASRFFSIAGIGGARRDLATIKTSKAFPENVELAFEVPLADGRLTTLHYSISVIPDNTGYKPRKADQRVGYFTTGFYDYGKYKEDDTRVRYINRWRLEKADPRLKMSPPKQPIRFYIEHTTPKRYRYWVKQGILYWNDAFEKVGIRDAIEVLQQDADTGAYMNLDPEDKRFNFIRWLNNDIGTAIGPSRVHPLTGEILDADIILTDGWIRHFEMQFNEVMPKLATEGFSPRTLAWLNRHPQWDPRFILATPAERPQLLLQRTKDMANAYAGHAMGTVDPSVIGDDEYDGLIGIHSQFNGLCQFGHGRALDMALLRMQLAVFSQLAAEEPDNEDGDQGDEEEKEEKKEEKEEEKEKEKEEEVQMLDGMPEDFIGPLVAELVSHEVGHTLGLRHNFKASSVYTLEEINSGKLKGQPHAGSVMDYLPINMKVENDHPHLGDYTMTGIGPYDYWAIEYGYTFDDDLEPILKRVSDPKLAYATDEDTWGADPTAWRYDFSKDPLDYAKGQMKLAEYHRQHLLENFVHEGDSWEKAREGYELTLALQMRSLSMMANWIGGAMVHRDKKGDPNGRPPLEVVSPEQQRAALKFVLESAFRDEAFGLTPELLRHLASDRWLDSRSSADSGDWPVHDRIMGIQSSVLTMLMNPETLRLVYDNELRTPPDEDMITLAELLETVEQSIWSELDELPKEKRDARNPWISSLRRNLQDEYVRRLIDLTMPAAGSDAAYKPIANLALLHLRDLAGRIDEALEQRAMLDPYSTAHLTEAKVRIEKAIDAEYIYNVDRLGGGFPSILLLGSEQQPNRTEH